MRLPPMTTRRWMIAMASMMAVVSMPMIVLAWNRERAAVPKIGTEKHDAAYYRRRAAEHARLDSLNRSVSFALMKTAAGKACIRSEEPTPLSEYHARLKEKYEAAARQPWLPVEPDPPPPGQ